MKYCLGGLCPFDFSSFGGRVKQVKVLGAEAGV